MDAQQTKVTRHAQLARTFTPNAPINERDLFRGRLDQILQISNALNQPGQHVVLYGERGTGKTSLANLLTELLAWDDDREVHKAVRINCTTQDTFRSIWSKAFRSMRVETPESLTGTPDPDDIRWALDELPRPEILVLDEFDRVEDDDALSLMADTIKSLSDYAAKTKLVIVGVADSLTQLIGEHESVLRALEEVHMPRMSDQEIEEIVVKGLDATSMTVDEGALRRLVKLCEGLPHYAHLLTLNAGQHAVLDDRMTVESNDIKRAVEKAVQKHSLANNYQQAVQSSRKDNLFSRVLAACALAEKNRLGYFTAGAVREPMSRIMRKPYDIPAFGPHLNSFTELDRGCVLQKYGTRQRYTYRFRNPLLQPFALFAALTDGSLPSGYEKDLFS